MPVSGQRSVRDTVAIDIQIPPPGFSEPLSHRIDIFFPQHLTAIHGHIRVLKLRRHPVIHSHIQIAQHNYRHLHPFSDVEGLPPKLKTFKHRPREEQDVIHITMPGEIGLGDITLGRASRQSRARPHPLNIPNNDRHLGIIGQTHIFRHQAETRS